jgi:hypothetical protein
VLAAIDPSSIDADRSGAPAFDLDDFALCYYSRRARA